MNLARLAVPDFGRVFGLLPTPSLLVRELDGVMRIAAANDAATTLLAGSAASLIGAALSDFWGDGPELMQELGGSLSGRGDCRRAVQLRTASSSAARRLDATIRFVPPDLLLMQFDEARRQDSPRIPACLSDRVLESILANLPLHVGVLGPDGCVQYLNRAPADLALPRVIGLHCLDLVDRPFRPRLSAAVADAVAGRPAEVEICRTPPGGETVSYHCALVPVVEAGETTAIVALSGDVTARQRERAALQEARLTHEVMFEALSESVVVLDRELRIQACNRSAAQLIGASATELIGRSVADPAWNIVLADGTVADLNEVPAMVTLRTGRPQTDVEVRFSGVDGRLHWVRLSCAPIFTHGGSMPDAVVASFFDVTERRALQERMERDRQELQRVSRIAELGGLAAAIAHQLGQPLTAISNTASTLRGLLGTAGNDPRTEEDLRRLTDSARQAAEILAQLRRAVSRGEGRFSEVSLEHVARQAMRWVNESALRAGVRVELDAASRLPAVRGDPVRLEHALINLLRNAVEALEEQPVGDRALRLVLSGCDDGSVCMVVMDNGPGVPEGRVETLFEPFRSSKAGGMGIGLAICRTIVEAHGGRIWYEQGLPRGAHFCVILPAASEVRT